MVTLQMNGPALRERDNIRVLLIDDDEEEYFLIRAMFSQMKPPYIVDWVADSTDAIKAIQENPPYYYDVYLIDYHLPNQTGVDLLREPILRDSDVPAIVITNEADVQVDLEAMEAGAADYLNKGQVQTRMLERTIRYALERANATRQIRQSEARYRTIVSQHPDMIIRHDMDGAITFANSTYCRYRDVMDEAPILGTDYLEPVLVADRKKLQTDSLRRSGAATNSDEVRAHTADGEDCWQLWTTQPIYGPTGAVLEYQSVIRDITERKIVEKALNQRLAQLGTLRAVDGELTETLDIESVISLALDSAMRLSSSDVTVIAIYDPETKALDTFRSYGLVDTEEIQAIYEQRQGVLGRVIRNRTAEYIPNVDDVPECIPSDPRMKSRMIIPLLSRDQFLGVVNVETRMPERFTEDVFQFLQLVTARIAVSIDNARLYTLLRKQLDEMRDLYAQVTELEQLKTDMIRIASHDLNNPLNVMLSHVELSRISLERGELDEEKLAQKLDDMETSVERMQNITQNILTLERFNENAQTEQTLNLTELLVQVAENNIPAARNKQIDYQIDLPEHATYIQGDPTQLVEAAANLINNAIKYTPPGGTVRLSLENDGNAAIFEVQDNGYGIPKEMQERLFQPFYRAKTEETADSSGSGLGLHLVKNIIERHDGRVIFSSRYKEGSTFGFQIPVSG